MASVCIGIWVGVGSRHESEAENGAAHFIEHMLFKGTTNRSGRDIVTDVEGVGGYLNAFTSEDHTCYYARAKQSCWPELLAVLEDMFFNATFPSAEVRLEREVIKEERAMYLDDPAQQAQELLDGILWPDHPLGRSIEGTDESLNRLDRRRLLEFEKRHYGAANTVIVAAGRISHEQLVKRIRRSTRHFRTTAPSEFTPFTAPSRKTRTCIVKRDIEQTQVALGIQTCSRNDARRQPVRLLNALLAENMSSRLYQVLREEAALAYSVDSHPFYFDDTGCLIITCGVDSRRLDQALKLVRKELDGLKDRAIGKRELTRARDYVIGQFDLYLESTENYMNWIGEMVLGHNRLVSPAMVKRHLAAVTSRDIKAVATEFLTARHMSLAVVGPRRPSRSAVGELMQAL